MTVQLYIIYPIAQAAMMATIFYLQTFYLRYRRNLQYVKDWHYSVITLLTLAISLVQILFSLLENNPESYYFIGRMIYPIFNFLCLIACLVVSTKAANMIDDDIFTQEQQLCEQAKILLYKV